MMDASERARLRALRAKATEGTWVPHADEGPIRTPTGVHASGWTHSVCFDDGRGHVCIATTQATDEARARAEADLIVGAVNALVPLLDAIDDAERAARRAETRAGVFEGYAETARVARNAAEEEAVRLRSEVDTLRSVLKSYEQKFDDMRASTLVAVPLSEVDGLRGLPCACDEWGPGHMVGCPNAEPSP